MTVSGDEVFKGVKMKSLWWPLIHYNCPYRERTLGHRHKEGRPYEDTGRLALEETNPSNTLILDFQAKNCEKMPFCCLSLLACNTLLWPNSTHNTPHMTKEKSNTNFIENKQRTFLVLPLGRAGMLLKFITLCRAPVCVFRYPTR